MKHLLTMAMMVVAALAANAATPVYSLGFLSKVGVDVSQLYRLPNHVDLSQDDIPYYLMEDKVHPLLDQVRHFSYYYDETEDGMEGGYSIAGVRDYGDERVLVLYSVEYGDGADVELASYNSLGQLVDFVDLGYWRDGAGYSTDDDPASDVWIYKTTTMDLPNDSQIVVHVEEKVLPIGLAEWTDADVLGRVDKTIRYRYNSLGQLYLDGIKSTHSGLYVENDHRFEDIRDLRYYPVSQYERIDKLNEMAVRPDVLKDMASEEYSSADYELHSVASDMIQTNSIQVMIWLGRHRENNLNKVFAQCARSGLIDVGMLRSEIKKKAPNPAYRNYIGRLLDQWQNQEN